MMQYSSRGHPPPPPPHPRGSPDNGDTAYNSFIDIAGFATTGAAASFASSPSHSTSTYSGSPPNKMDLTTPSGSNNYCHSNNNSFNARISMTVQEENEGALDNDEDYLHGVVDWPVDEEETHHVDIVDRKLQLAYPPPPPPAYPPPATSATTTTTISARNQQIFRAKGKSTTSGSTGTPSQSVSSKGSRSPNNNGRKIVAGGGVGGGIVFKSYETATTSNNATSAAIKGNGGHRTASTTIFDNIAEVVAARALDPTTSLSGNNYRRDNSNDRHLQTQRNMSMNTTSPTSVTKKTPSSSPEQTTSPQSEFRRTGMVNKLVSMFSNKQQQQHQTQNIQPMHTSSKQPTSTTGGVQFQLPISAKLATHPPAGGIPTLNPTTATTTTPPSMSNNENYFTHHHQSHQYPAISPARSNTQSSVTGTSGDSSSYNPTGWPGTIDKRGRTYVMESSYSEEDSGSWASPRRAAVGRNNEMGNAAARNEHRSAAASAVVAADNKMENWHQGSVVGGISVYDEEDGTNWRERRQNSSETGTAADVQLRAVLGNTRLRHDRRTSNNGGMQSYHSPPTNNSTLDDSGIDLRGSEERVRASGRRLANAQSPSAEFNSVYSFNSHNNSHSRQRTHHHQISGPQVLSEEALRMKDSQTSPPSEGGSFLFRGYRGFIDKTKDVPNLMDDLESEGGTSMGTGVYSSSGDGRRQQQQHHHHRAHAMGLALPSSARGAGMNRRLSGASSSNVESASDVFDGIIQEEQFGPIEEDTLDVNSEEYRVALKTENVVQPFHGENLPYSTQFNPFAASRLPQSSATRSNQQLNFERRHGPDNRYLGPALNLSAVTRGSSDSSPHHLDYMDDEEDGLESLPDLSIYCIQPEMVRKLVRAFRKICTNQMEISSCEETMLHDFENLVDTKKAFALFEMRSRIMETDIDRGLERKGGTNVEDDIVLTPYFQAAARVRDAVIVSKAWRDGATPKDVVTAHLLTRRSAKAYFVPRPIQRIRRRGVPFHNDEPDYWFEEVKWLDDTDFMLMRCLSLGAGTMKGSEMFTIGDCQSMLLKMTSDNCTVLRRLLRLAMTRQIEAEELMQEEIDLDGDDNIVAEAEQLHEAATQEVKTLSMKLVLADKAFAMVRSQMQKLVETIESLLSQVDNGIDSGDEGSSSSIRSDGYVYDNDSYASHESIDRQRLVDRAKRAELSAEVAVREALLAKQEAAKIKSDKQREIDYLKEKLAEMETQSQILASEHQKSFYDRQAKSSSFLDEAKSFLESTFEKEDATRKKNRLKQQFHERRTLSNPMGGHVT